MPSPLTKTLKVPQILHRAAKVERGENGEIVWVSIASDQPYRRYDYWNDEEYYEVLSHKPGGVDTERLESGLPVCLNHSTNQQLATAGKYKIEEGKTSLKFSEFKWTKGEFTENKKADMISGALPHTSVSYELVGEGICTGAKDGLPVYEFKWKPFEGGPVVIPADSSVGVGRSRNKLPDEKPREILVRSFDKFTDSANTPPKDNPTNPPNMKISSLVRQHFLEADGDNKTGGSGSGVAVDPAKERAEAIQEYKARCKKIDDHVEAMKDSPPKWLAKAKELAAKHKEGEANFDAFFRELTPHLTTKNADLGSPDHRDAPEDGSGVVVIGERQQQGARMTPGAEFTRAQGFAEFAKRYPKGGFRAAVKASYMMMRAQGSAIMQRAGFNSSDLAAVNVTISNQLVSLGVQRLTIMDLITPGTMDTEGFLYPIENSFDPFADAAGMVAERGLKPEWEPDLTTDRADAQIVAVMATIPRQFLQDFAAFQSWLDNRLDYLLQIKTEQQLLYGDGLGANLKGVMTRPGIQTRAYQVVANETTPEALFRGNTDIETLSYFDPDGFAMHPYDWEQIRLLKDLNGQYLAGGPFYAPYGNGMVVKFNTIWGLPVVITKSVKLGRPIAGAWKMGSQYFMRQGMEIETSNSHKDYFQRNLIAVLAEQRLALAVYRPIAFVEHTGFPGRA